MVAVEEQIITFIRDNFMTGRTNVHLESDTSLIESGIIDSTGVLELVMFLEETYNISVEDEELVPENLDTVANLMAFLKNKGVSI